MPMPDTIPETPKSRIRAAVADRLAAMIPELEGRVYVSRAVPTDARHWPCLIVATGDVTVEADDRGRPGRRPQTRIVDVIVSLIDDAEPETTLEDRLDWLAMRVEQALMSEPYLEDADGHAALDDLRLTETQTSLVAQRGAVRGEMQMLWLAQIRTLDGDPARRTGR